MNFSDEYIDEEAVFGAVSCVDINDTVTREDIIFGSYYVTGIFIICIICFIGNGLIVHAILYYEHLRHVHNWFILSLAVSDICQGLTIPFYTMGHTSKFVIFPGLGTWSVCQLMVVMITFPQTVSAYNLVGITFVRYLAVRRPLDFKSLMDNHQMYALLAILAIWILGIGSSLLLYYKPEPPENFCGVCRTELIYPLWQLIVFMLLIIILPVLSMALLYCCSINIISKRKREILCNMSTRNKAVAHRESRMVKVVSILLGFYTISWLPFMAYEIFMMTCTSDERDCDDHRYFRATSRLFYFSNVAANVFIYAGQSNEFKYALQCDLDAIKRCCGFDPVRRPRYCSSAFMNSPALSRTRSSLASNGTNSTSAPKLSRVHTNGLSLHRAHRVCLPEHQRSVVSIDPSPSTHSGLDTISNCLNSSISIVSLSRFYLEENGDSVKSVDSNGDLNGDINQASGVFVLESTYF